MRPELYDDTNRHVDQATELINQLLTHEEQHTLTDVFPRTPEEAKPRVAMLKPHASQDLLDALALLTVVRNMVKRAHDDWYKATRGD